MLLQLLTSTQLFPQMEVEDMQKLRCQAERSRSTTAAPHQTIPMKLEMTAEKNTMRQALRASITEPRNVEQAEAHEESDEEVKEEDQEGHHASPETGEAPHHDPQITRGTPNSLELKIATWNCQGRRHYETAYTLASMRKLDVLVITEATKAQKVEVVLSQKAKEYETSQQIISDRIVKVRLETPGATLNLIGVYNYTSRHPIRWRSE